MFLDESGSHIAMTREYARAPIGMRAHGRVPRNRGHVLTMLGALALDGVCAMMTVTGGTTRDVFLTFLRDHLLPVLRPGDVVVMDNLGAHHATGVGELLATVGATPLYMPAYSPDLNPIELCWSKLKAILKSVGARTMHSLAIAVQTAADRITPLDAVGWFRHAGCLPSTRADQGRDRSCSRRGTASSTTRLVAAGATVGAATVRDEQVAVLAAEPRRHLSGWMRELRRSGVLQTRRSALLLLPPR